MLASRARTRKILVSRDNLGVIAEHHLLVQSSTPNVDTLNESWWSRCLLWFGLIETSVHTDLRKSLLEISTCRELWLSELDDSAAMLIAHALYPGAARRLEVLRLGSNITDDGGILLAQALGRGGAPKLQELHLSGNFISDGTAVSLADALRRGGMPELRDLRLNHNDVADEGATALAEALEVGVSPTLSDLWLGGNRITDAGAYALARMLSPASHAVWTITTLALYSNNIGDAGATALADAVEARLLVRSEQISEHGDGLSAYVVPVVNVLLFGHMIQSEEVAQRVLATPGIEVYSSIELGQTVDEQVVSRQSPSQPTSRVPMWDPHTSRDVAHHML